MTDLDLDAIRARANAATLGPWTDPTFISDPPDEAGWWILGGGVPGSIHEHAVAVILPYNPHAQPDAEFVAHARTDVPALLAEVDRLRAELAESGQLWERLAALLTGTADALKGDPGPLSLHDWSDLPRVARLRAAELATSEAELARVTAERNDAMDALAAITGATP